MEEKNLNLEENNLTPEEIEQALTTAGEALEEIIATDGMFGEAALPDEMGPNDELTDKEAEAAAGGIWSMNTPVPTMTPTPIMIGTLYTTTPQKGISFKAPDGRIIYRKQPTYK